MNVTTEETTQDVEIPQQEDIATDETTTDDAMTAQEYAWQQDNRYKTGSWKNPDDIYTSYREMEKAYSPLKQKQKEYEEKLKTYETELGSSKQITDYLNFLLSDDRYKDEATRFFAEMNKKVKMSQYGADLPDEVYQRLQKVDEYEQKLKEYEFNKEVETNKSIIEDNMTQIKDFATKHNIEYDEADFLNYCQERKIPFDLMLDAFRGKAWDIALKQARNTGETRVLENLRKNNRKPMSSVPKQKVSQPKERTLDQDLDRVLGL